MHMHVTDIYILVSWVIWKCYMYSTEIFLFLLYVRMLSWPSTCKVADKCPLRTVIRNGLVTKKKTGLGKIRGLLEFCENKWQSLLCYAVIRCTPWDPTDDSTDTQSLESVLDSITTYADDEINQQSNDISNRDETNDEISNIVQPSEAFLSSVSNAEGISEAMFDMSGAEILNEPSSIDYCSEESTDSSVSGYYSEEQLRELSVPVSGIQEVVESPIITSCTEESTIVALCTEEPIQVSHVTNFQEELQESSPSASRTEKETHAPCLVTSYTEDEANKTFLENSSICNLYFRISTFRNYSDKNVFVTRLAQQGWYYRGSHNDTECHECHQTHAGWMKDDDPRQFHGTQCPFRMTFPPKFAVSMHSLKKTPNEDGKEQKGDTVSTQHEAQEKTMFNSETKGCETTNGNRQQRELSLKKNDVNCSDDEVVSGDSGFRGATSLPLPNYLETLDQPPDVVFRTFHPPSETQKTPRAPLKTDPQRKNDKIPKYPLHSSPAERKKSFNRLNGRFRDMMHTYRLMAEAGFFYNSEQNGIRCFFCGETLTNWKPGDDPWVEHARLFRNCAFLEEKKGRKFIEQIEIKADKRQGKLQTSES